MTIGISSDVSSGDDVLATQYNNLRTDSYGMTPTGSMLMWTTSTAPTDWALCEGGTIGNAASGASVRANADTVNLFTHLWNNFADAQLAVSGGRGASAAADYAANKTIELPNLKGRVPVGFDSTQTEFDVNGETGGANEHTLVESEMPSHTHTVSSNVASGSSGGIYVGHGEIAGAIDSGSTGGDGAHNNLQPYFTLRFIIRF